MENAQDLIAEFHNSNSGLSSHIRRTLGHVSNLYPLSTLPHTLISNHMSDAFTLAELPFGTRENTDPLPIPPHMTTPDAPSDQLHVQNTTPAAFVRVRDSDFPHPDECTPSELNDSDQENIAPPIQAVSCSGPTIHTPLRRTQAAIPFTDDAVTNQALLATITRVHNNVDRGNTYIGEIKEIVQITHALRHQGTPSEDDEAAALVARLHQIQQLEPESELSSSETPAPSNITFPTPTILRNSQVTASTVASHARVCAVASRLTSPWQPPTQGARGAGLKLIAWEEEYHLF